MPVPKPLIHRRWCLSQTWGGGRGARSNATASPYLCLNIAYSKKTADWPIAAWLSNTCVKYHLSLMSKILMFRVYKSCCLAAVNVSIKTHLTANILVSYQVTPSPHAHKCYCVSKHLQIWPMSHTEKSKFLSQNLINFCTFRVVLQWQKQTPK